MLARLSVFSLTCLFFSFFSVSAIQHPTGFITLKECVHKGAAVTYVLEEENGTKQFVLSLQNGAVVGEGGIVTNDGKILTDTETYQQDQQQLLQKSRDISTEDSIFFDGTLAVISSPGQQCYYHWLLQVLPRLKILADSKCMYDKIYICADNFQYHWQKDALYAVMDYLSIPHHKLLFIEHTIVEAKKLLVPSIPWIPSKPEFWDAELDWYKKFFNDVFLPQAKDTPKRIFISRSKAQIRRISNEKALMEFLNKEGFISYCLEDLSIQDQAMLFNNAEVIIGPHGAGLTNLIFCKPGTKIIEIDHGLKGDDQRSSYKGMANRMDCIYHPFYTDILDPADWTDTIFDYLPSHPMAQDMTVDIAAFKQFFAATLIRTS